MCNSARNMACCRTSRSQAVTWFALVPRLLDVSMGVSRGVAMQWEGSRSLNCGQDHFPHFFSPLVFCFCCQFWQTGLPILAEWNQHFLTHTTSRTAIHTASWSKEVRNTDKLTAFDSPVDVRTLCVRTHWPCLVCLPDRKRPVSLPLLYREFRGGGHTMTTGWRLNKSNIIVVTFMIIICTPFCMFYMSPTPLPQHPRRLRSGLVHIKSGKLAKLKEETSLKVFFQCVELPHGIFCTCIAIILHPKSVAFK